MPYNQNFSKYQKRISKALETWVFMFLMVSLLINSLEIPPAVKIIVPSFQLIFIWPQKPPIFFPSWRLTLVAHTTFLIKCFNTHSNSKEYWEKKKVFSLLKYKSLLDREGLWNKENSLVKTLSCAWTHPTMFKLSVPGINYKLGSLKPTPID